MPVPRGFLELSVDAAAMGPFSDLYPQGAANITYPVFGRFLLYWGDPKAPVPPRVTDYPAAVLYGGPAPFGWVSKSLSTFVRQWAATLAPREGAGPGSWLVVALPVAFLVPKEALSFPWTDFRWSWFVDQAPPAQYALEGVKLAPLFRNLSTRQLDLPPPLGPGPTAIAGELAELDPVATLLAGMLEEEDEIDPVMRLWLLPERAELEDLPIHPTSIEQQIGTDELGAWSVHDVWESPESGMHRLISRNGPIWETASAARSWKNSWVVKNFGKPEASFRSPTVWLWTGSAWARG